MSEQVKKDVIVIAREGYSVLLEVDGQIFDIDCYESVNLSNMFSVDVLERCSSLSTHLKDGNLIFFEEGGKLPQNAAAPVKIKTLREEATEHITAQYKQAEKDSSRTNMELETRADITDATRAYIQKQIQDNKKQILQKDKKLLSKVNPDTQPKERRDAMTPEELTMKVSMDVSPDTFTQKQTESTEKLEASINADEDRAEEEIAKQNSEQE